MSHRRTIRRRRGLTLAELLIATTIMLMIAAAVGTLAATVHSTNSFCQGQVVCAQHARVALNHIDRAVTAATANEQFPGCLVVSEQVGTETLPNTLVVWSPMGTPANPAGLPLVREIIVFAADPEQPNQLVELRLAADASITPAASDLAAWRTLTDRLKTSSTVTKVVLTNRLRTAPLVGAWNGSLTAPALRGVVWFHRLITPSDAEWTQYRAGTMNWQNLAWPLDRYGATTGTRAVVCQTELQLAPGDMASAAGTTVPFYGSAMIRFSLSR